ncbi:MAG: PAS domain-containing sensor histidine kinase [Pseudomonadota bacterium]|nr:PAS domain-containing sensor histidine kinase [Pseudomonadota bacterium]
MKNNRLGVVLIISFLLMIALVVGLLLQRQQSLHASQIRVQGVGVTRSLSAMPFSILAPKNGDFSVLKSLLIYYENPDFAYAAVTTPDGHVLADVTGPGVLVPEAALPTGTPSLFGERRLNSPHEDRTIREFYGPVMEGGSIKAFVRVGYLEPNRLLALKDLPFFALLALAMFLLVPLIYLIIKREMAPLAAIARQLQQVSGESALTAGASRPPSVGHDARSLAGELHRYLHSATTRIAQLEQDSLRTVASGRLLEYGSNKMNAVLQCLPDGLMILDPAGEVTFASSKIEPLLGIAIDQVLSHPVEQWCHDAPLKALFARYRADSTETSRQTTVEFNPVNVPDKRLWATAQPLVGGMGTMAFGTLIVLRDGTREHLGQQAGSDFVAHVSHELKSPLNVIALYSEMLQNARVGDEHLRVEAINVIHDEVERMNSLVNNLLSVSKLEMGSMRPERHRIKLDELLQDAFTHALPRAESRSVQLQIALPRELAAVSIDKDLFRIALNNLLTNAIKYSHEGGVVVISADENDHDIVITVRDNGIGIAAADQLHVFEKFYRSAEHDSSTRGGHGLGLYLASQIVELHHGRLTLDSAPGRGSAFSIHLKKASALPIGVHAL